MAILKLEGLTKTFSTRNGEVQALSDINIDIEEGEIFGIIGMSGAGKSTLVRCINLLEQPTSGNVIFDGKELTVLKKGELNSERRKISMIFQQFNLLMQRTAIRNVCFPLELQGVPRSEAEAKAKELLELVGLAERAGAYPAQLSGGQKQRVAIARALATDPKVLLCDEATSALDPKTTRAILELLKDINKKLGLTIIVITHEMSVVQKICDRVAVIDGGTIAELGKTSEIFAKPKTEATKRLVYPDGQMEENFSGSSLLRIVFDGPYAYEPIIANMILECGEPVNIIYANMQDVGGQAIGQMIVRLPADEDKTHEMIKYLKNKHVKIEEVRE